MYAVIFRAKIKFLDQQYYTLAYDLRDLAQSKYGCQNVVSYLEGNEEITISYWPSLAHIDKWQKDPLHRQAQKLGQSKWYHSYSVEVAGVMRSYHHGDSD